MTNSIHSSPQPVDPKAHQLIDYTAKKPSFLERHVVWHRSDHGKYNGLVKILRVVELIFGSLFVAPLMIKGLKHSANLDAQKKFEKHVQTLSPPEQEMTLELKSPTKTFTHTHEIVIHEDTLWVRPRASGSSWKPMYFDGFKSDKKPVSISADGANLIVIDENNKVHYKKLIREYRKSEMTETNKRAQEFIKGKNLENENEYVAIDKTQKNNWKEKWFSLPVISDLILMFRQSKKLALPENPKAIAISHRGRYNDYVEDAVSAKHPVSAGVTTLYMVENNGKVIRKYDPWSPENAKMDIYVPESSTTSFEVENMDASASHIMLLGYESSKRQEGEGVVKRLTIKTKLADIDSEGWNPGLKYAYEQNPNDPKVRVISTTATWKDHPLDLKEGESVTRNISVVQLGEGNNNREIRIEGKSEGLNGYFYKRLDDPLDAWEFKPFENAAGPDQNSMPLEMIVENESFQSSVADYISTKAHIKSLKKNEQPQVSLENFGIGSTDSPLTLEFGDETLSLTLHRKKTLKNFFGIEGDSFDLVIPDSLKGHQKLQKVFQGKKSIPVKVSVKENPDRVMLTAEGFNMTFHKSGE